MVFYFPPGNLWDEDSVATHFVGFFSTRKFAACKQSLLGKSASELAMYTDQAPPDALPPHAEVTDLRCNLMLCGLGGLSEKQIAALLTSHGMQRIILCGKPGRDSHVTALQKALPLAGLSGSDMYLIPVAECGRRFGAAFQGWAWGRWSHIIRFGNIQYVADCGIVFHRTVYEHCSHGVGQNAIQSMCTSFSIICT